MEMRFLLIAFCAGIGATLLTDLWNLFLRYGFKIQSLDFCFLGRWILYMPGGIFRHQSIRTTPQKPNECVIGWMAHYSIGVALALLYIVIAPVDWLIDPTLLPALLYGMVTVVFPLFILQPSLGLGYASSKTPNPAFARVKSMMTHLVFGIGLWLSTIAMNFAIPDAI